MIKCAIMPVMTATDSPAHAAHAAFGTFAKPVLRWFDRHGRKSLPWQKSRDPYGIWVAEIMLQQTRVSTVIPYYRKFMARFPDIAALARCQPDALLHCWSGLGYYARARNLQAAAQKIMAQHSGKFPDRFDDVLALPGIGRSTAGAILAFCFAQRHPILDGNVKRVLMRCYAIAGHTSGAGSGKVRERLWKIAEQRMPKTRVGDYHQALMDLDATVCLRTKPLCACCPLARQCVARQRGDPTAFPQAKPKTVRPCKAVTMLLVKNQRAELLLVKRPPCGIWGGLWSLPEYADESCQRFEQTCEQRPVGKWPVEKWFEQQFGFAVETDESLPPIRHSFTHFDLDILPLPATVTRSGTRVMDTDQYLWYNPSCPAQVGLPSAVKRILGEFHARQNIHKRE